MNKNLTFTTKKLNGAVQVIDSKGFICGIFSSVEEVKNSIDAIYRNIVKGKVNLKYATFKNCRPKQFKTRR